MSEAWGPKGDSQVIRNPKLLWTPADLTPQEYEKQVVSWLRKKSGLDKFEVRHLEHMSGPGGDYEFDAVAELTVFQGARIVVLIECKRYKRPVEREKLLALWAKLQDVKAHKAMMFATSGFQSGAIKYARAQQIATITIRLGSGTSRYETTRYETRLAAVPPAQRHGPLGRLPKHAGLVTGKYGAANRMSDLEHTRAFSEWLNLRPHK